MNRSVRRIVGVLAALSLSVSACQEEPVRRHVQLEFVDAWPHAETSFLNNALRVQVNLLEALPDTSAMNVWLEMHDGTTLRAGVVGLGEPAMFDGTTLGVDWAEVHEVTITEEHAGETPAAPSTAMLFMGEPGTTLMAAVDGATTGLAATALIEDGTLTVTAPNLPLAGTRMFYGVWLLGSHLPGDAGTQPTFAGRMYGRGTMTFTGLGVAATRHEVAISVELESGSDAPSLSTVILRGVVPTSAVAAAGTGGAAPPPEPSGHVH